MTKQSHNPNQFIYPGAGMSADEVREEQLRQLREDQRSRNDTAGNDDGDRPYMLPKPTSLDAMPLVAPRWSEPVVPPEPPLGWSVDELPDMTTANGDNVAGNEPWQYGRKAEPVTADDATAAPTADNLTKIIGGALRRI